jgi:hypothetical protein
MKRLLNVVLVMFLMVYASIAVAAWKSTSWKYNTGDLRDDDCIQEAIDDLDARLDAWNMTNSTAVVAKLGGICTNTTATYITFQGDWAPVTSNGFSLGTAALPVKDVRIAGSIYMGGTAGKTVTITNSPTSTNVYTFVGGVLTTNTATP